MQFSSLEGQEASHDIYEKCKGPPGSQQGQGAVKTVPEDGESLVLKKTAFHISAHPCADNLGGAAVSRWGSAGGAFTPQPLYHGFLRLISHAPP